MAGEVKNESITVHRDNVQAQLMRIMKERKITQTELGERTGFTRRQIYNILNLPEYTETAINLLRSIGYQVEETVIIKPANLKSNGR